MTDKSIGGFLIVEKRFHRRCGGGASISFPAIAHKTLSRDTFPPPSRKRMAATSIFIISAIIAAAAFYLTSIRKSTKYNYPPSPPGYNFFKGGHAYMLPQSLDVTLF
jgi:hypothetical protein